MPDITNIHQQDSITLKYLALYLYFMYLVVVYRLWYSVYSVYSVPVIQLIFPRDVTTRFVLKFSKNLRIIGSQSVSLFPTKYYAGRALKLLK